MRAEGNAGSSPDDEGVRFMMMCIVVIQCLITLQSPSSVGCSAPGGAGVGCWEMGGGGG